MAVSIYGEESEFGLDGENDWQFNVSLSKPFLFSDFARADFPLLRLIRPSNPPKVSLTPPLLQVLLTLPLLFANPPLQPRRLPTPFVDSSRTSTLPSTLFAPAQEEEDSRRRQEASSPTLPTTTMPRGRSTRIRGRTPFVQELPSLLSISSSRGIWRRGWSWRTTMS